MAKKSIPKKTAQSLKTVIPCKKCKWRKTTTTRGSWSFDSGLGLFVRETLYECKVCKKTEWNLDSKKLLMPWD